MNVILRCVAQCYWAIYRLTPRGRRAWMFKKGLEGLLNSNNLRRQTQLKVIRSAADSLRPRKILAFFKGRSITKSKASNHEVLRTVHRKHDQEMKDRGLRITQKGKFKNA